MQDRRGRPVLERFTHAGARRWYVGSLWGIVFLAIPIVLVWSGHHSVLDATLATIWIGLIAVAYLLIPPFIWGRGWPFAVVVLAGFAALTCVGLPLIGSSLVWLWLYIPIMSAMSFQRRELTVATIGVVVLTQVVVITADGDFATDWSILAITCSISVMMLAFSEQIRAVIRLREAEGENARLAVTAERERFARDLHDVLGHTLTVVSVKSQLARRLVAVDPGRAEEEIADVERMSRAALTDLRAAVAGYRDMTLATELAAADSALAAAEISAHLPAPADTVAPQWQELFAWVLRESVTNVVRHSGARNCWVALERHAIVVGDDGRGGVALAADGGILLDDAAAVGGPARSGVGTEANGHGLSGLAERVRAAGARLSVEPSEDGGVLVTVRGDS